MATTETEFQEMQRQAEADSGVPSDAEVYGPQFASESEAAEAARLAEAWKKPDKHAKPVDPRAPAAVEAPAEDAPVAAPPGPEDAAKVLEGMNLDPVEVEAFWASHPELHELVNEPVEDEQALRRSLGLVSELMVGREASQQLDAQQISDALEASHVRARRAEEKRRQVERANERLALETVRMLPANSCPPLSWAGGGAGYPQPGEMVDIWALWVKQGRKGAAELHAKYGGADAASVDEERSVLAPPTAKELERHIKRYGRDGTEGIEVTDRSSRERPFPEDWKLRRSRCFKRDAYVCQRCQRKPGARYLSAHHIRPRADGGSDAPNNLITLCTLAHSRNRGLGCHDWVEVECDRGKLEQSRAAIIGSWTVSGEFEKAA